MRIVEDVAGNAVLRRQVEERLEHLSRQLMLNAQQALGGSQAFEQDAAETAKVQNTVKLLGQVVAEWAHLPEHALPESGAGFASMVMVEDCDQGTRESYTLMTGALLDIEAGQVSLASPIGQALLGAQAGDVVTVETPQRRRRLRVIRVRALQSWLEEETAATTA